ncbi:hypothetical protein C9439_07470 [archaeon SCG-AAA382B04]|nr:hypothetical protein C9439_07470 [archaeon SCG-AAA382B04]
MLLETSPLGLGFGIFMFLLIIVLAFAPIILFIWVIYDSIVVQKKMEPIEKLIWIIASVIVPLIVPIIYYLLVKREGNYLLGIEGKKLQGKETKYDKLEKLHELKEKGVITEEEYQEKRKQLVDEL